MTNRAVVFCIRLNKTGTSSLHAALTILGYRSLHEASASNSAVVQQAIAQGKPMLEYLAPDLNAVSDLIEVTYNFDLADRQYPGSRFILTVRDLEAWVDSRRRHVERNREAKAAGMYDGSWLDVDEEEWIADYRRHEERVRAYFADRPGDLLVMNIAGGDGWEPLCAFLGHSVPNTAFPHKARYRPWSDLAIASRWPKVVVRLRSMTASVAHRRKR